MVINGKVTSRALVLLLTTAAWIAQAAVETPYAGEELREIKAMSAEEINGYLQGSGLGYAKAAELNHYPGPRHVLELAQELQLSAGQSQRSQALFDSMKLQAIQLGEQLIDRERVLENDFSSGSITPERLLLLTREIGGIKAEIRYVHLSAHIEQKALLTEQQMKHYDRLRGYGQSHETSHGHSH